MEKKVVKTENEWKKELTPGAVSVCRMKGTERPFTGEYYQTKAEGIYTCSCCGAELFDSSTKYESGSGWPSFYKPADAENIQEVDRSQPRHDAHRSHVQIMRGAPGSRLPGWSETYRVELLHQFRFTEAEAERVTTVVEYCVV